MLLVRQAGHLEIRVYFGIKLDISNDISLYQLIIRNVRSHKFYGILENSIHQKYKIRFVEIDWTYNMSTGSVTKTDEWCSVLKKILELIFYDIGLTQVYRKDYKCKIIRDYRACEL